MVRVYVAAAMFLLVFGLGRAQAQIQVRPQIQDLIYRPLPQRWAEVGSRPADPVASGKLFDLAFGPDGLPVLASIDRHLGLHFRKWDGRAWPRLNVAPPPNSVSLAVKMASSREGDIVVALLSLSLPLEGSFSINVFRLEGSELVHLGTFSIPGSFDGYAITFDGQSPVFALQTDGFVTVSRWNGAEWTRLGRQVNPRRISSSDEHTPSLAVTADGRIVVAFSSRVGGDRAISTAAWNGSRWVALGDGIPSPSESPSLGGGNGAAPVAAFLNGRFPEVRHFNGSAWSAARRPCEPPRRGTNFGRPSLTIRSAERRIGPRLLLDQPMLVCGIARRGVGTRELVARIWIPGAEWARLGTGSINGAIPLADGFDLAFVMRSDWRGQPWVAWTTTGQDGPNILVSTLVPVDAPNP